jgi:hypothetical protein
MKLVVESEISATSYKKLVTRLRHLNKKQLWEVLDHYIFHVMSDNDVTDLMKLLDEKAVTKQTDNAEVAASALDDDLFFTIDPRERFRPPVIATVPTDDNLEKFKAQLDLLYDQTCFDHYIEPEIRTDVAQKLVGFATEAGIPVLDHWKEFSEEGVNP